MKLAILDDYQQAVESLDCFKLLDGFEVKILHEYLPEVEALAAHLKEVEALVLTRTRTRVGADLLARLPDLRLISQTGKNAGHIDLEACTRHRVALAEGRGNPIATAELTWALILNGLRQIPQAIEGMKAGHWQLNIGRRVYGKRVGIWGYGKIGQRIALYARSFGAEAMIWGSEKSRRAAEADGFLVATSKAEFFSTCDVISLHLRWNKATHGIVRKSDLLAMRPDALLVNTARAGLIEAGALLGALQSGRPGFAAVDVYESEPIFDPHHPLLSLPNVICTPHLGYVERDSYELYYGQAFENVCHFAKGTPRNIANPEVL